MRLAPVALLCLALPATAQDESPDEALVGGVGRLACSEVTGAENAIYLGQVGDWALGYLAGRIDAGQTPAEDTALSPTDSLDIVAGVALRCREAPDQPVIDAVRDLAANILGEAAQGGPVVADPPPPEPDLPAPAGTEAPPPRPDGLADDASDTADDTAEAEDESED